MYCSFTAEDWKRGADLGCFFVIFFFFFLRCTVKPCVLRRFLQRKQNKSCLELKGCIVGESGGWTEGAQADRDGWWMARCNRAHRDWRLFVATNGIVHIFHCNPRLRPRKGRGGTGCYWASKFWWAHGCGGLRRRHTKESTHWGGTVCLTDKHYCATSLHVLDFHRIPFLLWMQKTLVSDLQSPYFMTMFGWILTAAEDRR